MWRNEGKTEKEGNGNKCRRSDGPVKKGSSITKPRRRGRVENTIDDLCLSFSRRLSVSAYLGIDLLTPLLALHPPTLCYTKGCPLFAQRECTRVRERER